MKWASAPLKVRRLRERQWVCVRGLPQLWESVQGLAQGQPLGRRKRQLTLQQPGLFLASGNGRCDNVSWTCPTFYSDPTHLGTLRIEPMAGAGPPSPRPGRRFTRGNKKRTAYMDEQGQPPYPNDGCPRVLRSSTPRRPALPLFPAPQSAPTRTSRESRVAACPSDRWASPAPRP